MKAQIYTVSSWIAETDSKALTSGYTAKLQAAGFQILSTTHHHFNPAGFTILFLLAESHLALHTFPEENCTFLELSSCVKKPFDQFVRNYQL